MPVDSAGFRWLFEYYQNETLAPYASVFFALRK